ncbi:AbiV family abortive infection protein [Polaribacter sp. L3A8]|uniref:AbiV family abortive infection protein n=1 Tax=Polaribacter sp. L3A8 TaxID=2686361 RepID=UPI00131C5FB5|nr:AbiV family abortive infection protein [Polaribacter sp. L3A8]
MVNLESEELKNGILKCFNNSKSLLSDADYLFEGNRFARAYSIYRLSIEENQKSHKLINLIIEKSLNKDFSKEEKTEYNKFFTDHLMKIRASAIENYTFFDFFEKYNLKQVKTKEQISNEILNPKQIDLFKQYGFYTHLINKKFKQPSDFISKNKCQKIQSEAQLSLSKSRTFIDMFLTFPEVFIRKFLNVDFSIYDDIIE